MSSIHLVLTALIAVGMIGGVLVALIAPRAVYCQVALTTWTLTGCAALSVALLWTGDIAAGIVFGLVPVFGTWLALDAYGTARRRAPEPGRVYPYTTPWRRGLAGHTATVERLPADCVTAYGAVSIHDRGKRAAIERYDGRFVRILWVAQPDASDAFVEETAAAHMFAQAARHGRDRAETHMCAGAAGQDEPDWYATCPRCTQLAGGIPIEWPCVTARAHGLDQVRELLAPVDEATFAETSPF